MQPPPGIDAGGACAGGGSLNCAVARRIKVARKERRTSFWFGDIVMDLCVLII